MDVKAGVMKIPLTRAAVAAAITVVLFAFAIGLVRGMDSPYGRTYSADTAVVKEGKTKAAYRMDVRAKIVGVDLARETLSLQLECIPVGEQLFRKDSNQLAYPITLTLGISPEGIQKTVVFKGRGLGQLVSVNLDLTGNVARYPWDRHTTTLWLQADRYSRDYGWDIVPVRLAAYGAWPGLNVTLDAPPEPEDAGGLAPRELHFLLTRSYVTLAVVYLSIALTWILIYSVVSIALSVLFAGRRLEIAMLAYFGTLLFAMTAFRNALPGVPPMGATCDYLAFFWSYGVAIVGIGIISVVWNRRRTLKGEEAPVRAAAKAPAVSPAAGAAAGGQAASGGQAATGSGAAAPVAGHAAAPGDPAGPGGPGAGGAG